MLTDHGDKRCDLGHRILVNFRGRYPFAAADPGNYFTRFEKGHILFFGKQGNCGDIAGVHGKVFHRVNTKQGNVILKIMNNLKIRYQIFYFRLSE